MGRITIIISVSIGILLFTGCASTSSGASKNHAYQNYITLKKARLEREAAGNYTGYEKGTAEYAKRSNPQYIAARKKKLKSMEAAEKIRLSKIYKEAAVERAQQEKINNDPRVVAARIEAKAIRDSAKMQQDSAQALRTQMKLNQLTNTLNNMTPKRHNVNVYHYGY